MKRSTELLIKIWYARYAKHNVIIHIFTSFPINCAKYISKKVFLLIALKVLVNHIRALCWTFKNLFYVLTDYNGFVEACNIYYSAKHVASLKYIHITWAYWYIQATCYHLKRSEDSHRCKSRYAIAIKDCKAWCFAGSNYAQIIIV